VHEKKEQCHWVPCPTLAWACFVSHPLHPRKKEPVDE
jgi:hypothetical protein